MPIIPKQQPPYYQPGISHQLNSYKANATQTSTNPPVMQIMQDTFQNIIWTRLDVGDYIGTQQAAFPANKTWASISGGDGLFFKISRLSDDEIEIQTFDQTGAFTDGALVDISLQIITFS